VVDIYPELELMSSSSVPHIISHLPPALMGKLGISQCIPHLSESQNDQSKVRKAWNITTQPCRGELKEPLIYPSCSYNGGYSSNHCLIPKFILRSSVRRKRKSKGANLSSQIVFLSIIKDVVSQEELVFPPIDISSNQSGISIPLVEFSRVFLRQPQLSQSLVYPPDVL
jgi:hypothetical protein